MPEGIAHSNYIHMAPRKIRRVLELVRGKNVEEAINILHFTPKAAAAPLEKTIRSAIANLLNAEGAHGDTADYVIKGASVDGGPTMRRFRAGPMGRAMRLRKRTSHITVIVGEPQS